ncbi:MAG TPA: hypothetical protein VFE30_05585 [Anaeromyxobacteraceae bacterium]|jgi:hypothetical protein|nr:hypothetical protein [Anaeromyxobacteraceae bacterium]
MPNDPSELVLVFGPADAALAETLTRVGGFGEVRFCERQEEALGAVAAATPMLILISCASCPELAGFLEHLRDRPELASVPVLEIEDIRPMLEGRAGCAS